MFEYMSAGKPIVASKLESIEEVLTDAETAFLAKGNPQDLAEVIKNVFADRQRANFISNKTKEIGENIHGE